MLHIIMYYLCPNSSKTKMKIKNSGNFLLVNMESRKMCSPSPLNKNPIHVTVCFISTQVEHPLKNINRVR